MITVSSVEVRTSILGITFDVLVEVFYCAFVLTKIYVCQTPIVVGSCARWVMSDGLVVSFDRPIGLAKFAVSKAFVIVDYGVIWVVPDGLVVIPLLVPATLKSISP